MLNCYSYVCHSFILSINFSNDIWKAWDIKTQDVNKSKEPFCFVWKCFLYIWWQCTSTESCCSDGFIFRLFHWKNPLSPSYDIISVFGKVRNSHFDVCKSWICWICAPTNKLVSLKYPIYLRIRIKHTISVSRCSIDLKNKFETIVFRKTTNTDIYLN